MMKNLMILYLSCAPVLAFPDPRYDVPADLLFEKKITKESGSKQVFEIDLGSITRVKLSNTALDSSLVFLQFEDGGDWFEDYSPMGPDQGGCRSLLWLIAKRIKVVVDTSNLSDQEHEIRVHRWSSCMAPLRTMFQYFFIRFEQHQTEAAAQLSATKDIDIFAKLTETFFEIDDNLQSSRWWFTYMGYMWKTLKKVSFNIEAAQFNRSLFYDKIYNYYKVIKYTIGYGCDKTYAFGTLL